LYYIREEEDGAKVVRVSNLDNPYKHQDNFDKRFKLSLNKLYAWSLVEYDRVVMLDADNLFLQNTDELFQCGQFCATFINPCVFHTGLFVLQVNSHCLEGPQKNSTKLPAYLKSRWIWWNHNGIMILESWRLTMIPLNSWSIQICNNQLIVKTFYYFIWHGNI
jgi:hypothetical protein